LSSRRTAGIVKGIGECRGQYRAMRNPVLIELTRGALVESTHTGAVALARTTGELVAAVGDIVAPVFPRSAIKPLQAIAFVEGGAVDRFGYGAREIALASASHTGTPAHTATVLSILQRAGLGREALACGVHEPMDADAMRQLIRTRAQASALHHNCSGKHAAMLATAAHEGEPTVGYWRPGHPVQMRIVRVLEELSGARLGREVRGIDGCSVPNWAMPLRGLALAYARFAAGEGMGEVRARACRRIAQSCWAYPDLVAGPGRLDTRVMSLLQGKVLMKSGAEGVYCGALPELGLGFAVKIDDGAKRAAEAAVMRMIMRFYPEARETHSSSLTNWQGHEVGVIRPTSALDEWG
jgi:L-asparaginase II